MTSNQTLSVKLSVVIPARNEAGNIGATVDGIVQRLRRAQIPHEIIVVDDHSNDDTAETVRTCAHADAHIRLVTNQNPQGFGYAVRCGLAACTGEAIVTMMADGSDDPDDLLRYYAILKDQAECAFGSRFIAGGAVTHYPGLKLVLNRLANGFIRLLFGLKYNDVTNAFKGYRAHVIQGCQPLLSPHFNLTVELPLKAIVRGYSYAVIPIHWRQRTIGRSMLRIKEMGSRYLFIILHIWLEKLLVRRDYHRA